MRLVRPSPKPATAIGFVVRVVPRKPDHTRVAFEREDVSSDAVEKPAVVAYQHGTARELDQGVLERSQRVDVEIVSRLVQQQQVASPAEQFCQVHAVSLAAGERTDRPLLIAPFEVEPGHVRA